MVKKIKRVFCWYVLLNKRFLKKYIFTLLLLAVPVLVFAMKMAASGDNSLMRVLLYQEGEEAAEIVDELMGKKGVIRYEKVEDLEEACEQVQRGKADAVWRFPENFGERVKGYVQNGKDTAVYVYVREDTVSTRLAREQLYGVMYPLISREMTRNFLKEQSEFQDMEEAVLDREMDRLYEENRTGQLIFQFSRLDQKEDPQEASNYLTAPLRGMLALLILLCGLAMALFYMQDEKEGRFSWMRMKYRRMFPWLYILVGISDAGIAAYVGIYAAGTFTEWRRELILMVLYVVAVAGFCNLVRSVAGTVWKMGACIPILILIMLVLSPVFVNIRSFPVIQHLLPPWYYLNSLYSRFMMTKMFFYAIAISGVGILLDFNKS